MGLLNVKVVLISIGILSMAMRLKLTVPMVFHFILSEAPSICTFFLICLTLPYLYILLNFIILTILASSKFHSHSLPETPLLPTEPLVYASVYDGSTATVLPPIPEPVKISAQNDYNVYNNVVSDAYVYEAKKSLSNNTVKNGNIYKQNMLAKTIVGSDEVVITPSLQRKDSLDFAF